MAAIDHPAQASVNEGGPTLPAYQAWFALVGETVRSLRQSGATADRPAKALWIGRQFFDTTLGHPVWVQSVNPAVWVDGTGTVV